MEKELFGLFIIICFGMLLLYAEKITKKYGNEEIEKRG